MKVGNISKVAGCSIAFLVLVACGKTENTAANQSTSTPAVAQQPTPTPQAAPVDRSQYKLTLAESNSTFGEQEWKKFHQTAVEVVSHSNATTPDVMAALKFPEYAKMSNPFDKDNFKKSHQADLVGANATGEKIKFITEGMANGYLEPGDPLHGVYKGTLTMTNDSIFGYRFEPDAVRYVLKQVPAINFQKNVSEDQAKIIESKIKRDNEGRGYNIPVVIYATVVGTSVSYGGNGGQIIEIDVKPDAVDLADKLGPDAQPILQVLQ